MKKSVTKVNDALDRKVRLLYNVHVQELFDYGMRVCDDQEVVKQCLQELFIHVWDECPDLRVDTSTRSYLFRSFRKFLHERTPTRTFTSHLVNRARPTFAFKLFANDDVFADQVVSTFADKQRRHTLTDREAEVVFLKFHNKFSHRDVANIMDLDVVIIYNLISAAVERVASANSFFDRVKALYLNS